MIGSFAPKDKGFALIAVIWILVLLIMLALSFTKILRRESDLGRTVLTGFQQQAFAASGISVAKKMLTLPVGERWIPDGRIYSFNFQGSEIRVRVFSERGKINLNTVEEGLLDRVLMPAMASADERQTLVQAILDWRDSDDYRRLRGAEYKQYEQSGLRYRPNNSLFSSVQQLQWVLGMSGVVYDYLRPLFTVWSKGNKVDRALASVDVLNGLEGPESHTVIDLYQQRILTVEEEGSTGQRRRGSDSNPEDHYYTLIAQAKVGHQLSKGIEALVKTDKAGPNKPAVHTVMWQETDASQSLFAAALDPLVVWYSL